MTKPLWAPWRLEYIQQADELDGCLFCDAVESEMTRRRSSCTGAARRPCSSTAFRTRPATRWSRRFATSASSVSWPTKKRSRSTAWRTRGSARLRGLRATGVQPRLNLGRIAGAGVVDDVHLHVVLLGRRHELHAGAGRCEGDPGAPARDTKTARGGLALLRRPDRSGAPTPRPATNVLPDTILEGVMRLEGVHHITAITAHGAGVTPPPTRSPGSRAASRQEDGEPGRPDRLPPVRCRRAGQPRRRYHLLRVPGRPGRAVPEPGMVHRAMAGCRRGGDRGLPGGAAARSRASRPSAPLRLLRFADPEGLGLELAVVETARRAAGPRITPTSWTRSRCRVSTGSARTRPIRRRAATFSTASMEFQPIDETQLRRTLLIARLVLRLRPGILRSRGFPAPGRFTMSPGPFLGGRPRGMAGPR